mmetsp:Transcript_43474/g.71794  ORF Transcript_43474/g.71794 Transcript_43474/m.71794 type:complete len:486 (+) Transcript_43474:32-1489(+)
MDSDDSGEEKGRKVDSFSLYHRDMTVMNNDQMVKNTSLLWTYWRSAYGDYEIPSMADPLHTDQATWIIRVDRCGDICLGIAPVTASIACDELFTRDVFSYGYTNEGVLYKEGQPLLRNGEKYEQHDRIKIVFDNKSAQVSYYRSDKEHSDRFDLVNRYAVQSQAQLSYKLAVSLKSAQITLEQFEHKRTMKKRKLAELDEELGQAIEQLQTPPQKKSKWQCEKCSTHNTSASAQHCRMCNSPRKLVTDFESPASSSATNTVSTSNTTSTSTTSSSVPVPAQTQHDHASSDTGGSDELQNPKQESEQETQLLTQKQACFVDLQALQTRIVKKFNAFHATYNAQKLRELCQTDPDALLDRNGDIQGMLASYERHVPLLIDTLCNFDECVQNIRNELEHIVRAHESRYEDWNLDIMMQWIEKLDNGKFKSIVPHLRTGFEKSQITNGGLLPSVDYVALSTDPFNIASFPLKKSLEKHFQSLEKYQTKR